MVCEIKKCIFFFFFFEVNVIDLNEETAVSS